MVLIKFVKKSMFVHPSYFLKSSILTTIVLHKMFIECDGLVLRFLSNIVSKLTAITVIVLR